MHIPRFAANVRFIYFDFAGQLAAFTSVLHRKPDAMEHKPRRLLGNSQIAVNLPRANPVSAVGNQPKNRKPFIQADRGVFHDRADLDGELPLRVTVAALPALLILQVAYTVTAAPGTLDDSIGPTLRGKVMNAIVFVAKVSYCLK